jgi:hypothetical protein
VGRLISANFTARERRAASQFFGGPESTRAHRDQLRTALAASTDAELVSDLRFYFNTARTEGETISAAETTSAIRLLGR